jgi:hypothetical protein
MMGLRIYPHASGLIGVQFRFRFLVGSVALSIFWLTGLGFFILNDAPFKQAFR